MTGTARISIFKELWVYLPAAVSIRVISANLSLNCYKVTLIIHQVMAALIVLKCSTFSAWRK